jgi:integrase
MATLLDTYEMELLTRRKMSSVKNTMERLGHWHDPEIPVANVRAVTLARRYRDRVGEVAVDTHRNELAEVKSFWRWAVDQGYVRQSPAERIQPVGRRRRGKPQLRRSGARKLYSVTVRLAQEGDDGALAVLTLLLLGLRSSELLERRVGDVDVGSDGVLLWVDRGKTHAAERHHDLPEPLTQLYAHRVAGEPPEAWLYPADRARAGHRRREWLQGASRRLCKLAGVPYITPHGLRGTRATLTREAGILGHVVARELGHASEAITQAHYLAPGAEERARTRQLLKVIDGGG